MTRLRKRHVAGFLGILALVGCRQDMHDQPRLKALAESDFYADLRSARNPVDGTVARGQLHEDAYFHTGKVGANPGNYMPSEVPANEETLARGRELPRGNCESCSDPIRWRVSSLSGRWSDTRREQARSSPGLTSGSASRSCYVLFPLSASDTLPGLRFSRLPISACER